MDKLGLEPPQAARLVIMAFGKHGLQPSQACEASKVEARGLCGRGGYCTINIEVAAGIDRPCVQMLPEYRNRPSLQFGQRGVDCLRLGIGDAGCERRAISR